MRKRIIKSSLATLSTGAFFGFMWIITKPGREKYLIAFFAVGLAMFIFALFYLLFFSEDSGHANGRPQR